MFLGSGQILYPASMVKYAFPLSTRRVTGTADGSNRPVSQQFSPSGEQCEHRKLAHEL